jgi:hypothetical protein
MSGSLSSLLIEAVARVKGLEQQLAEAKQQQAASVPKIALYDYRCSVNKQFSPHKVIKAYSNDHAAVQYAEMASYFMEWGNRIVYVQIVDSITLTPIGNIEKIPINLVTYEQSCLGRLQNKAREEMEKEADMNVFKHFDTLETIERGMRSLNQALSDIGARCPKCKADVSAVVKMFTESVLAHLNNTEEKISPSAFIEPSTVSRPADTKSTPSGNEPPIAQVILDKLEEIKYDGSNIFEDMKTAVMVLKQQPNCNAIGESLHKRFSKYINDMSDLVELLEDKAEEEYEGFDDKWFKDGWKSDATLSNLSPAMLELKYACEWLRENKHADTYTNPCLYKLVVHAEAAIREAISETNKPNAENFNSMTFFEMSQVDEAIEELIKLPVNNHLGDRNTIPVIEKLEQAWKKHKDTIAAKFDSVKKELAITTPPQSFGDWEPLAKIYGKPFAQAIIRLETALNKAWIGSREEPTPNMKEWRNASHNVLDEAIKAMDSNPPQANKLTPCFYCGQPPAFRKVRPDDNDSWEVICINTECSHQPATKNCGSAEAIVSEWNRQMKDAMEKRYGNGKEERHVRDDLVNEAMKDNPKTKATEEAVADYTRQQLKGTTVENVKNVIVAIEWALLMSPINDLRYKLVERCKELLKAWKAHEIELSSQSAMWERNKEKFSKQIEAMNSLLENDDGVKRVEKAIDYVRTTFVHSIPPRDDNPATPTITEAIAKLESEWECHKAIIAAGIPIPRNAPNQPGSSFFTIPAILPPKTQAFKDMLAGASTELDQQRRATITDVWRMGENAIAEIEHLLSWRDAVKDPPNTKRTVILCHHGKLYNDCISSSGWPRYGTGFYWKDMPLPQNYLSEHKHIVEDNSVFEKDSTSPTGMVRKGANEVVNEMIEDFGLVEAPKPVCASAEEAINSLHAYFDNDPNIQHVQLATRNGIPVEEIEVLVTDISKATFPLPGKWKGWPVSTREAHKPDKRQDTDELPSSGK